MSVSAQTASALARNEPPCSADCVDKLSFAYISLVLSVLFHLVFTLFTACTISTFFIIAYQLNNNDYEDHKLPSSDNNLLAFTIVSALVDVLYFWCRLRNRAKSAHSATTYAAYFREKPAALFRLCRRSPHHRRMFFRWQGALRWMVPLDVIAVVVCVIPIHVNASPQLLYTMQGLDDPLNVYHYVLTAVSTVLEAVVAMECLLEFCRRWCGPEYPDMLLWHPQTGNLAPIHPHQYQEALLHHQHTPPHAVRAVSYAPASAHPVHPPPAYGHQDVDGGFAAAAHQVHMPQQYMQPQRLTYRQQYLQQQNFAYTNMQPQNVQPHYQSYYAQQQPYMQPPLQYAQPQQQQQYYARPHSEQLEGEPRAEGQPRESKVDNDEKADGVVDGGTGAGGDKYGEEVGGQGGEQGAATEPLVMMMSPALMDDDDDANAAAPGPRVMLRVRPSDADRAEDDDPRP